jgi:Ca2+-dependent lipid-binding protein
MRVELSIHAFKLKNVAGFFNGTSDPFAVVTKLCHPPEVIGRTEVIPNTLSPNWVSVFVVDYELGTPFHFAVSIFDENARVEGGSKKPMGSAVFDLGSVLAAHGSTKAKSLKGKGTVFVTARKSTGSGTLRFKFKAQEVRSYLCLCVVVTTNSVERRKCTLP